MGTGKQAQAAAVRSWMRINRPVLQTGHRRDNRSSAVESGLTVVSVLVSVISWGAGSKDRHTPPCQSPRRGPSTLGAGICPNVLRDVIFSSKMNLWCSPNVCARECGGGEITGSVRIWKFPHVRVGGRLQHGRRKIEVESGVPDALCSCGSASRNTSPIALHACLDVCARFLRARTPQPFH